LGLVPKINPSQPSLIKEGVAKNPHDKGGMGGFDNYKKNISNLILFFEGKKKKILQNLKKEMMMYAKRREFERAGDIKKQIFALNHINDVALIKEDIDLASSNNLFEKSSDLLASKHKGSARRFQKDNLTSLLSDKNLETRTYKLEPSFRIEAYDIAHTGGKDMVGAFVVLENGEKQTNKYRLFNIKGFKTANDTGALREVISRRLKHIYPNVEHGRDEWQYPDLIVADGNQIQKSVIEKELKKYKLKIPVVAVVKDEKHKARAIIGDIELVKKYKKDILLANVEVHRYVIKKHRIKRGKTFLGK
jgi:excinuclease ABC subunit C